ncbi:CopG family ribbon-helix-helix protein [Microcoleus sp. OTE_8_concoct_300]|jgi:predicted transcriptional regulator|uniref:CopG family ribbon-helix-helix protein n=1 Tax=Microcoleus sp. OTE_8_concoct_300 TaxID=2964710 RepID=UPI00403F8F38
MTLELTLCYNGIIILLMAIAQTMSKENMMLTLDSEKKAALSAIATLMNRDLSDVVNEAISTYLEMNQRLLAEITTNQEESKLGDFIDEGQKKGAIDLQSRGINREQAANLRARLQSFAEDWNCPEMDVYDAL